MQAAAGIDVTPLLAEVRCPVLVLHRVGARVISLEMSEALAAGLPNARLELLPGNSASLFYESTDEIVDLLIDFVGGRPVATGDVADDEAAGAGGRLVGTPRTTAPDDGSPEARARLLSPREL